MPLPLLTRHAEGADDHDGHQSAGVWAVAAGVLGGPRPAGALLPPPGTHARPRLRPRVGAWHLRGDRPPLARSGRVLQAATDPLLRGAALGAPTAAGRRRSPQPALVPRRRPDRAAARPLQPDAPARTLRPRRLPPLFRADRRAMH